MEYFSTRPRARFFVTVFFFSIAIGMFLVVDDGLDRRAGHTEKDAPRSCNHLTRNEKVRLAGCCRDERLVVITSE